MLSRAARFYITSRPRSHARLPHRHRLLLRRGGGNCVLDLGLQMDLEDGVGASGTFAVEVSKSY